MECHEPDSLWEYHQERHAWMAEAMQIVLAETQWHFDAYSETII